MEREQDAINLHTHSSEGQSIDMSASTGRVVESRDAVTLKGKGDGDGVGEAAEGIPVKRKRPQSCDTCRHRKIKCVRLQVEGIEPGSDQRCVPCRAIDSSCTYEYVPKRPGPQSSRLTKQQQPSPKGQTQGKSSNTMASGVKRKNADMGEDGREGRDSWPPHFVGHAGGAAPTPVDYPMSLYDGAIYPPGYTTASSALPFPAQGPLHHPMAHTMPSQQHYSTMQSPSNASDASANASQAQRPRSLSSVKMVAIEQPKSLEDIAPRQTFLSVIALYFHHLYSLLPVVHRPTFSHDLVSRRDEADEDFLAFVLSLTAYTLVQAPRSVVPAPWPYFRKLHRLCHLTSRRLQPRTYNPAKVIHLCTLYCDHIYLGSTGLNNAANSVLGEAIRTCYTVGIHDERCYTTTTTLPVPAGAAPRLPATSAIERELRRRIYFLLYGSDKTIAVLQDEPICLRDDDSFNVRVPLAVDDDRLTEEGAYPQPLERGPSILCGFEIISRLYLLLSELLESYRADRRRPLTQPHEIENRKQYISGMLRRVKAVLGTMPPALHSPSFLPPPRQQRQAGTYPDSGATWLPPTSADGSHAVWPQGTFDTNGLPSNPASSEGGGGTGGDPGAIKTSVGPTSQTLHRWAPYPTATLARDEQLPSALEMSEAMNRIAAFRPSPPPPEPLHPPILSPFATMRANILITETMIRFVLNEYRELLDNFRGSPHQHSGDQGLNDDWETAAKEMVETLQGMPLESLAANGQSMIAKLLYLTSSLLNRSPAGTRGYQYLCDFLGTLTRLTSDRNNDTADDSDG